MTEFSFPAEIHADGNADGVPDHVVHDHDRDGHYERHAQDTDHDGWWAEDRDGQVDRLSYDLDGGTHFDLVKQEDDLGY